MSSGLIEAAGRGSPACGWPTARHIAARKLVLMLRWAQLDRARGLLPLEDLGAPIDVFWFAVPKPFEVERCAGGVIAPAR